MDTILEAINVNKKVAMDRNELHILKDINLRVTQGEMISVMGPSGSGKSTLLYNISGMDRITSGDIMFKGEKINRLNEENLAQVRLRRMGFIFQHIHLLKNLSLLDNVMFPGLILNHYSKNSIQQKALKLMRMTGISHIKDNKITQASGGQLQRVAICRALINNPDIIFGDEPTGALDSKSAEDVMTILAQINQQGTTILLVTHDAKIAAKTERVLFMVDGRIVSEIKLGKYDPVKQDLQEREELILKWLVNNRD